MHETVPGKAIAATSEQAHRHPGQSHERTTHTDVRVLLCLSKVSHFLIQPMPLPFRVLSDASPVALRLSTIMGLAYLVN